MSTRICLQTCLCALIDINLQKTDDSTGPFSDLALLEKMPGVWAVQDVVIILSSFLTLFLFCSTFSRLC